MSTNFTAEDVLTGLYKLAYVGAGKSFNIDLIKLEDLSGRKLEPSILIMLAMLGAETEDEIEFVRVCEDVLE